MSQIRVVFLGTPDFAVTCLKGLVEDEHFEVVGVVTQPDRPSGRKMQLQPSPVKSFALSQGLQVISPESVNTEVMLQQIESWGAEVAVVVAFGQIMGDRFLKLFPLGAVNVHGSLLPRWRGAAPIQRALEFGDQESGVCLQKMVKKLDAGDVLGQRKVAITESTTAQDLFQWMAEAGADLLRIELMDYIRGNLVGQPQEESLVTYAKKIDKGEGLLDWSMGAAPLSRKIRAFVMGPGTWSFLNGKKLKIHQAFVVPEERLKDFSISLSTTDQEESSKGSVTHPSLVQSGLILKANDGDLWVQTGEGVLGLLEVQPESRNKMKVSDFLKGYHYTNGDSFKGNEG